MKKQIIVITKRNEGLRSINSKLEGEIFKLQHKFKSYEYFKNSFDIFRFAKATGIVENKQGDVYILMEKYYDNSLVLQLSGIRHQGANGPILVATVRNKIIFIDDFYAREEDVGNGTLLLQALDKKAKEIGAEKIVGELSTVDKDHFDKLEFFYSKNGFEVIFTTDRSSGRIQKQMYM